MGWLRSVGSIKLQVFFPEERLFYRALLQKKPIDLSILLTVATPRLDTMQQVTIPVLSTHFRETMQQWPLLFSRGGGLGSRPKKMYGERLGDGVEYHLMSPTPRR